MVWTFIGTWVTAVSVVTLLQKFIPEIAFTWQQMALIGSGQANIYVLTTICVAEATEMSLTPFAMAICLGPMVGPGAVLNYLFARRRIPSIPDFSKRYAYVMGLFNLATSSILVYPAYATAYMHVSSSDQLWFSLLLLC